MKMKNPLGKRVLRELKKDFVKYAAIFIMMVLLVSMCSGMRVSNESLKKAYYDSFELYRTEDGHITFDNALPEELRSILEEKAELKFYENMYTDTDMNGTDKTIRTYRMSDSINDSCLLSGEYPDADDEIVIDRLFAKNNKISTGDSISLNGKEYTVTGLIALAQYSTLYEKNTDAMFDSVNFCVAEMTDEGFEKLDQRSLRYNYAWMYNSGYADDTEQAELSENFLDILEDEIKTYDEEIIKKHLADLTISDISEESVKECDGIIDVDDYIPRYLNNAINFAIEDIGKDEAGTMVMCYMMIALIAFIFAVTISGTIVSEASVIGTLRASGYSNGEIIRHYMTLPVIVTVIAGIAGNITGYTFMKNFCADLYLGSYSLTAYETVWDPSAFILSTVVPIILMLIINFITLSAKLKLSPLRFLRRDLKKNGSRKAMRLSRKIPYRTRFSLRIFFTNLPGYIVMIVGIIFGAVLISFGDMLPRLLDDMKELITEDIVCDYQYILYDSEKSEVPDYENAEKFAMSSFDFTKEGFITDEIVVYGIEENSRYVKYDIPAGKAVISEGISEKYGLKAGDIITLDEKFKRDSSYTLEISGVCDYLASLAVFTDTDNFNKVFGKDEDYFTGYFSDIELDINPDDTAAVMTLSDYTKVSDQLTVSMGGLMGLFKYFGALFFIIVVYVLCKQITERNFQSISLTKILGFSNSEIASLYIISTAIAVITGLGIAVPAIDIAIKAIFKGYLYTITAGYIPCIISPVTYVIMTGTGLACFAVVAVLQMIKVAGVSKSEALKNVE